MEVILLENIIKLGKIGDLVKVRNGYGRNFLLKNGKALRADKKNIEYVKRKKDEINKKNTEKKLNAKNVFDKIKNKKVIFKKETKENGELFASIKPKEIAKYFSENFKETIHPSQIDVKQEINKVGSFQFSINLHSELVVELRVIVEKKEAK